MVLPARPGLYLGNESREGPILPRSLYTDNRRLRHGVTMNDIIPLYDRIEVLEKTVLLLLERLNLDIVQHDDVYIELKEK